MKNKNHLHCRQKFQNPFKGETRLLFMAGTPDDPDKENEIPGIGTVESLTERTPTDPTVARLTATTFDAVSEIMDAPEFKRLVLKWENLRKEMNAVQNSIDHIKKYQAAVERRDLRDLDFIARANSIMAQLKKLKIYADQSNMGDVKMDTALRPIATTSDYELEPDLAAKKTIFLNAQKDIQAILAGVVEEFEKQKQAFELQMRTLLIDELEAIVQAEEKEWIGDDNIKGMVTEASYKSTVAAIAEWKTRIAAFRRDPSLVNSDELLYLKSRFDELFTDRRDQLIKMSSSEVDIDKIASRVDELDKKLNNPEGDINKLFDPIAHKADELLQQLAAAEAMLDANPPENYKEIKEGKDGKGGIKEMREKLEKSKTLREQAQKLFNDKSQFPPNAMLQDAMPQGLKNQVEFIRNIKDPLKKKLYEKCLEQAVSHAEKQINYPDIEKYYRKDMPDVAKDIKNFTDQFSEKKGNNTKKKIYWVSWYDATRGWEIIKTWTESRMHRVSDLAIGKVGEKVVQNAVGNIPGVSSTFGLETLSTEFSNKVHETEHHEVDRLAASLKPHDNFHILHMLHEETRNVDQLKAIINVLCERGAMRFDDPILLKLLNNFQKRIIFDTGNPEKEFSNGARFYLRLKEATSAIWDPDVFRNWTSQNSSAYESGKKKFENECNKRSEESEGGLRKYLKGFLQEVREKGDHGTERHKVDAQEYEEIIQYCIDNGKLSPEDRIYYLIQGIATGLLTRTRGSELASTANNKYPCIELFAQGSNTSYEDVFQIARIDADKYEPGPAYKYYFEKEVMHLKAVRERLEKSVSQGNNIDHDDFVRYGAHLEDKTMENLLQQKTGGFQLPATGVANCTVGFLNYIDIMAHGYEDIPEKEKELARFASMVVNFDNITRGRKYADRSNQYFRWSGIENNPPRAAGSYMRDGTGNMSAKQHMAKVKSLLYGIDPFFFEFIERSTIPDPAEVENFVKKLKQQPGNEGQAIFGDKQEPKNFDTLLDVAGEYLQHKIKNNRQAVLQVLAKIREDQKTDAKGKIDEANIKFRQQMGNATLRRLKEAKAQGKNVDVAFAKAMHAEHTEDWDKDPEGHGWGHHDSAHGAGESDHGGEHAGGH